MNAYYKARPEVLALVPKDAKVIVDVGCGSGILGQAIKASNQACVVYGIEPFDSAAAQARAVLDDVLVGTAEDPWPSGWSSPDCIIFADTLEHMVDPWAVLSASAQRLKPDGCVVLSVPNVAHHSSLAPLLFRGQWNYVDQGILDRTHLRFFVRKTVFELTEKAGLEIEVVRRQWAWPGGFPGTLLRIASFFQKVAEGRAGIRREGRSLLDHATLQYLIRARPPAGRSLTRGESA